MKAVWIGGLLLASPLAAGAHDSGAVYLNLYTAGDAIRGELDLGVPDVLALLSLPIDLPEPQAWGEFERREPALADEIEQGIRLEDKSAPCAIAFPAPMLLRREEAGLARIHFTARCAAPLERPSLHYSLLLDLDPKHRAFVALHDAERLHSVVLDAATPRASFDLRPVPAFRHFTVYLREGIRHVSTGFDHLLFLAALLLPAALARSRGREIYASFFVPVADAIYDLFGAEGVRAFSWRERYINYVPFVALVLLTPSLGARRRAVGLAAGGVAIFASHVLINGLAQRGTEGLATLPVALSIASDSLPFLLWAVIARDFVRDVARRVIAPPPRSSGDC